MIFKNRCLLFEVNGKWYLNKWVYNNQGNCIYIGPYEIMIVIFNIIKTQAIFLIQVNAKTGRRKRQDMIVHQ